MKVEVKVPNGQCGKWRVEDFEVRKQDVELENMRLMFTPGMGRRTIKPGKYKRLMRGEQVVMSNTPAEVNDHNYFIRMAKGDILINGLGLGVVLQCLLEKESVKSITIIEKYKEVINLVGPTFQNDPRVKIIHADALEYNPPKGVTYDYVWHDIWDNICADNLEEMKKLHKKYGRKTKEYQGSWCRDLCEMYRK